MFPTFLEEHASSVCSVIKERCGASCSYVWNNIQMYGGVVLSLVDMLVILSF
jgi:hypothetical protein